MPTRSKHTAVHALTGRILSHTGRHNETEMYAVAGAAYDESLLVHLYAPTEMNNVLYLKCYKLLHPVLFDLEPQIINIAYADISNLVSKHTEVIKTVLDKQKQRPAVKLCKADVNNIAALIKAADTIPECTKCKYFDGN